MCLDKSLKVSPDISTGMCIGICLDIYRHVYRHMSRHMLSLSKHFSCTDGMSGVTAGSAKGQNMDWIGLDWIGRMLAGPRSE